MGYRYLVCIIHLIIIVNETFGLLAILHKLTVFFPETSFSNQAEFISVQTYTQQTLYVTGPNSVNECDAMIIRSVCVCVSRKALRDRFVSACLAIMDEYNTAVM